MPADGRSFFLEGTNGLGVVLVHGLTGAPAEMRLVARQFHRRGFSVYAPLLAGHGETAAVLRRSRWQDWLDSVETGSAWLGARTDAVFAAGICVGGKLAMMAAYRNADRIRAVGVYSPCFNYDGWDVPRHYALISPHIGWISHIPFLDRLNFRETASLGIKDARMRRMVAGMTGEGMLDSFPGRGLVEMYRLGRALKSHLPEIRTPTLIMHSREDDLSGPAHAEYIAAHLGGRRELHWLDDSYHMIHVDRQHRQVADLTADFFEADHASSTWN